MQGDYIDHPKRALGSFGNSFGTTYIFQQPKNIVGNNRK